MGKISTPLKIVFFSLLLVGIIAIQYSWITTVHEEKLEKFKSNVTSGLYRAANNIPFTGSLYTLTDTALANTLQRSLFTQGLGTIPFEFNLSWATVRLTSRGFNEQLEGSLNNFVFYHSFDEAPQKPASSDQLIVIIPSPNYIVWKEMAWFIVISLLLTLIIPTAFYYAIIWRRRGKQPLNSRRDNAIENMMQRLENPLTTISVAVEALRNARVMQDVAKIKFYQQVINEENNRIDEELKRLSLELK